MIAALFVAQALLQPVDPRIQFVSYNAGQVVTLSVASGYATVVELVPEERIDTVVVGDSIGWQITTSRAGNRIVVKPLAGATTTNLVVITDVHRYAFLLQSGDSMASPFIVRFLLPPQRSALTVVSPERTFNLAGDKRLHPLEMRSDGQRTRIRWGADAAIPAIFADDTHGKETMVNGRMVDGVYVIEGAARRYTFRIGKRRATATVTADKR